MNIAPTPLDGLFIIELNRIADERGSFMRTFSAETFTENGLNPAIDQTSLSFNTLKHTLRGLHYQAAPVMEDKLVRCAQGIIFDVAVDLREASPTRGNWFCIELRSDEDYSLYIPQGFAHGFLTLTDNAIVSYQIAQPYHPNLARGIRWDDPDLAIEWPHPPSIIGPRDQTLPWFREIGPLSL